MSDIHTYQRIMERLDPEEVARVVSEPNGLARETFPLEQNRVHGCHAYQNLVRILTRYVQHHMDFIGCGEWAEEIAFGKALEALKRKGLEIKDIYDDCVRSTNGGLRKVIDIIAEHIEREQVEAYTEHVLSTEIANQLDYDEIESLMVVWRQKFGKLLPYALRSTGALAADWRRIILETASTLSRTRSRVGKL